jgi:hypothetical protein
MNTWLKVGLGIAAYGTVGVAFWMREQAARDEVARFAREHGHPDVWADNASPSTIVLWPIDLLSSKKT